MYCSHCGKEIANSVKFCPYCGEATVAPAKTPEAELIEEKSSGENNAQTADNANQANPDDIVANNSDTREAVEKAASETKEVSKQQGSRRKFIIPAAIVGALCMCLLAFGLFRIIDHPYQRQEGEMPDVVAIYKALGNWDATETSTRLRIENSEATDLAAKAREMGYDSMHIDIGSSSSNDPYVRIWYHNDFDSNDYPYWSQLDDKLIELLSSGNTYTIYDDTLYYQNLDMIYDNEIRSSLEALDINTVDSIGPASSADTYMPVTEASDITKSFSIEKASKLLEDFGISHDNLVIENSYEEKYINPSEVVEYLKTHPEIDSIDYGGRVCLTGYINDEGEQIPFSLDWDSSGTIEEIYFDVLRDDVYNITPPFSHFHIYIGCNMLANDLYSLYGMDPNPNHLSNIQTDVSAESNQEKTSDTTADATAMQAASSTTGLEAIISDYKTAQETGTTQGQANNLIIQAVDTFDAPLSYAYADIAHDGEPELLIGQKFSSAGFNTGMSGTAWTYRLYEIWGINNGSAELVIGTNNPDESLGLLYAGIGAIQGDDIAIDEVKYINDDMRQGSIMSHYLLQKNSTKLNLLERIEVNNEAGMLYCSGEYGDYEYDLSSEAARAAQVDFMKNNYYEDVDWHLVSDFSPSASSDSNNQASSKTKHSYDFIAGSYTWEEAKLGAETRGGHLATITSEEEWNSVLDAIPSDGVSVVWAGGFLSGNSYQWVSGESFDYTHWAPGEPNNDGNSEDKLCLLKSNNVWNWYDTPNDISSVYSADKMGYVVEYE